MFRGYLFVQISSADYHLLAGCCKVARILPINTVEEERLVKELRGVQRMEELSRHQDVVVKPEIETGRLVEVKSGPLQGTKGIVDKRGERMRVTVNLEILGQSVATDLDIGDIEILS